MTFLPIKKLLIYTTTSSGMVKYLDSNLTLPIVTTQLISGLSSTVYISVSPF